MDSTGLEFYLYEGDLMGLTTTDNHLVFRWNKPDCNILFSMTRQGDSANCHFASNKNGLRYIKEAVDKFVRFVFSECDWCRMVIANVERPSVERLVKKCGFKWVAEINDIQIYARSREWAEL